MSFSFKQLGMQSDLDVLNQQVDVTGKHVVDVGCGTLSFSKKLLEQGAHVLGIDPDPTKAEENRSTQLPENLRFIQAGADQIPTDDASVDGLFFSYSFHHIPPEIHDQTIREIFRVLVPDNGFVYVIEPVSCPLYQVMKYFNYEDDVRAAAWNSLEKIAERATEIAAVEYHSISEFESWEAFVKKYAERPFSPTHSRKDVDNETVKSEFEKHAIETENGIGFKFTRRVVYLRQFTF